MSLNVTGPLGVGEQAEAQTHNVWDTIDDVMTEAMKEGFFPVNKPKYRCPELDPQALTHATPEQYAMVYAQLEAWQSYTSSVVAAINGDVLQCDNEMGIISADIRNKIRKDCEDSKTKKPGEAIIADTVTANPRYRELLHQKQTRQQKKFLVEGHYKRLSKSLAIVSRFIELRKMEMERQGQRRAGM